MPNGTLFRLDVAFSPIHIDANSISTVNTEDPGTDLSQLTEEDIRITKNIVAALRRLADLVEKQGLDKHNIYGLVDGKVRHQLGYYYCRFRPE